MSEPKCEVYQWLHSISNGLTLDSLAVEFESRGFQKISLPKYVKLSDLDDKLFLCNVFYIKRVQYCWSLQFHVQQCTIIVQIHFMLSSCGVCFFNISGRIFRDISTLNPFDLRSITWGLLGLRNFRLPKFQPCKFLYL